MKYLIFLVSLCITVACSTSDKGVFSLEGVVAGSQTSERIYLSYPILKNDIWYKRVDTAKIIGGRFRFEGKVPGTVPAYLSFDDMDDVNLYLEPAKLHLRMDRNRPYAYTLSGSSVEKENRELRDALGKNPKIVYEKHRKAQELNAQWLAASARDKDSLWNVFYDAVQAYKTVLTHMDSLRMDFVLGHMEYAIAPHLLYLLSRSTRFDNKLLQNLYDRLPGENKGSVMGQLAGIQIGFQSGDTGWNVGDAAPDFSRTDAGGRQIRLSDYKNRNYVLLDFWASWCGPCLKELPKVKGLYAEYGKRGLQVIGISTDDDRDKWLHAIGKHEITACPQILSCEPGLGDYKLFFEEQEDIAARYDILEIPCFVLIDKKGRIVARWQHIEQEQIIYLDGILK